MSTNSRQIKTQILDFYYQNVYAGYLFSKSTQARGIDYFEKSVEKFWNKPNSPLERVLELGSGKGEHLTYVKDIPTEEYVCLDIRPLDQNEFPSEISDDLRKVVKFVHGNVEQLPFEENKFNRTVSTCLLHHLDDPLQALLEARRVTKIGGELIFAMPTDPGILNHLVKRTISVRQMKSFTKINPWLIYSLEHRNHISGLLNLIQFVFSNDQIKFHYLPFKFKSWNLNLICIAHIVKTSKALPEIDF